MPGELCVRAKTGKTGGCVTKHRASAAPGQLCNHRPSWTGERVWPRRGPWEALPPEELLHAVPRSRAVARTLSPGFLGMNTSKVEWRVAIKSLAHGRSLGREQPHAQHEVADQALMGLPVHELLDQPLRTHL